jgi:hypothetical protein
MLVAAMQTSVAQILGSIDQAVNTGAPYNTVYFGIYPQTLFQTALEAMDHSPSPLYPTGPFVVVNSDNQALNGGALSSGKSPRPQATIIHVEPLKWRIVKDDADGILLFTDGNVDVQAYNSATGWDGTWNNSSLRAWLENAFLNGQSHNVIPQIYKGSLTSFSSGTYNDLIGTVYDSGSAPSGLPANALTTTWTASGSAVPTDYFTAVERTSIVKASLTNPTFGQNPDNVDTEDYIFLPAADVVESVYSILTDRNSFNTRYVMSYENTTSGADDWLTRSHSTAPFPGFVTQVTRSSGALNPESTSAKKPIRPALYLARDKVLMVSQSKPASVSSSFTGTSLSSLSSTLKLTLEDNSLPPFTVSSTTPPDAVTGYITVSSFLSLTTAGGSGGADSYISCLLEDNTGIKYYKKAAVGTAISVPLDFTGVTEGTYKLKVFNEIVNSTDKPDRASAPVVFDIYVASGTPTVVAPVIDVSDALSDGFVGRAYSDTVKLSATGTPAPNFTLSDGSLPMGLTLNGTTGRIVGTPTAAGTYTFKIKAQNPAGFDEKPYTVTVSTIVPPVITTSPGTLAQGYLSMPYSIQFELQSGTGQPSVKFYRTAGVLPAGLTLEANGLLHGTPVTVETQNFTVCAETEGTYAYASYSISILVSSSSPQAPVFVTTDLGTTAKENELFTEVAVQITGSQYMDVQYDPTSFPTGMTFDPYTRKILGTPIQGSAGAYELHLWAKNPATKPADPLGPDSVGIKYPLTVAAANVPVITTPSALPAAAQDNPYSVGITTDQPATLTFKGGILPSGVVFIASPASLSGTPTGTGSYTFTIEASTVEGATSKTFTLPVQPQMPAPVIDAFTLPDGMVGEAYTGVTIPAFNSPTSWSWTGAPAGLALSSSGTVSGIPTAAGVYDIVFTASNAWGISAGEPGTVTIRQSPLTVPPVIVTAISDGIAGMAYHQEVFLFNRPDIEWTVEEGVLPYGLTFKDGVISGTPLGGEGKFIFTVKAASAGNQFAPVTKELTIWIISFTEEYRSRKVTLPVIPGMTTDLEPNIYYVKSGGDFTFVITPADGYDGVPAVTTGRWLTPDVVDVTANSDGVSYTVVIRNVLEDVTVYATPSDNMPVERENPVRVWSDAGRLYIFTPTATHARIYDTAGYLVKTVPVEANRTAVSTLNAGLYIVELEDKTVYKTIVR